MHSINTIQSLPILSVEDGRNLGAAQGLLFDPSLHMAVYMVVAPPQWYEGLLAVPMNRISGIGGQAVIVQSAEHVQPIHAQERAARLAMQDTRLLGQDVYTSKGEKLGCVKDVFFQADGRLGEFLLEDDSKIPARRLVSMGSQALFVSAEDIPGTPPIPPDRPREASAHASQASAAGEDLSDGDPWPGSMGTGGESGDYRQGQYPPGYGSNYTAAPLGRQPYGHAMDLGGPETEPPRTGVMADSSYPVETAAPYLGDTELEPPPPQGVPDLGEAILFEPADMPRSDRGLVGRRLTRMVEGYLGIIGKAGDVITRDMIDAALDAGKLVELTTYSAP